MVVVWRDVRSGVGVERCEKGWRDVRSDGGCGEM